LMNSGPDAKQGSWLERKLFSEHLIEQKNGNHEFYADIIPDLYLGRDLAGGGKNTFLRSIGLQLGGNVDDQFSYHVSAYNNRVVFPDYIHDYIDRSEVVPGQQYGDPGRSVQSWNYLTANISYTPTKYLNISLAYDK